MDVKKLAADLIAKFNTDDPFIIAKRLKIQVLHAELKSTLGFYSKYVRIQSIILNQNASYALRRFVCAHELGHAICHPDTNTQKLKMYTLFSTDKIEREANAFAVELLISDRLLREHTGESIYSLAKMVGVPEKLAELKNFSR